MLFNTAGNCRADDYKKEVRQGLPDTIIDDVH